MAFITENTATGDGTETDFSFTFPYINESDVKVTITDANGDPQSNTDFTFANATTLSFNTAPANGRTIRIFRDTNLDNAVVTFFAGSAIRAEDLNDNQNQVLFSAQEVENNAVLTTGSTITGDQVFVDANIVFEGATEDDFETTLTVVDPTADRTITLPNVTGTVVTTGDTNTVTGTMIAADAINGDRIADDSIDSEHYVDGSIDTAHIADAQITTAKLLDANVTTAKIADSNVTTAKIADSNVTTAKIADANVTTAKIADANVTTAKIANDAVTADKIPDDALNSEHYAAGSIDTEHIADSQVTTAKIAADAVTSAKLADDVIDSEHLVDASIDTQHIADLQITTAKIAADAVTNAKIADDSIDSEHYVDGSIDTAHIADSQVTTAKLADDAVTGAKIADTTITSAHLTADTVVINSEQSSASVNDTSFFTTSASDGRYFRQDSTETITSGVTWSSSDAFVATTGAINARIIDLVDDVGGFTAVDNETSFPATNPQGNTGSAQLMSIKEIETARTATNGTVTIANGSGSNTVTITGCPATLPADYGMLVETTSTLHTYTFHRLVPRATEVTTVANNATSIATAATNVADINNFADLYQIANADPTQRADNSDLEEGDLVYRTDLDVVRVYDGSSYANITPDQATIDDITIVADEIASFNDLGSIADALVTENVGGVIATCADLIEGSETFTVTVANSVFVIDGTNNPVLTLRKGWTYTFDVSDASNSGHPLRFRTGTSTAYTTGVTTSGTAGNAGATVVFVVPDDAPSNLRYYCTAHGNSMGNTITVVEDPVTAVAEIDSDITTVQTLTLLLVLTLTLLQLLPTLVM
jgi:uncharacterized protein YjbI with pentapeptide repeats